MLWLLKYIILIQFMPLLPLETSWKHHETYGFLMSSKGIERGQCTVWKISKYGVSSGPYFAVFSSNTEKYRPEKTLYLDTFHLVMAWNELDCGWFFENFWNRPISQEVKDRREISRLILSEFEQIN